jgi:two-component system, NtrC family, sensor kinase
MSVEIPELVRSAVAALPDPAVVVDLDLRVIQYNDAYFRLSGLKPREIEARRAAGLKCTDLLSLDICQSSCAVKSCTQRRLAVHFHEVSGQAGPNQANQSTFLVTSYPVLVDGQIVAAVEIYRDVTAERRVQERFQALLESERRHSEQLEIEVRRRTAELEQSLRELKETRDHLVQSEKLRSLGQLVAGIAHELNNPINFIYGNTSFLRDYLNALFSVVDAARSLKSLSLEEKRALDETMNAADLDFIREDSEKLVKSLRTGAERTAQIVRGLRTFARTGQAEFEETDLVECIETTATVLSHLFKGDVRLVKRLDHVSRVRCNSSQIGQVVMNLIKNARDAVDGNGEVAVDLAAEGEQAVIRVRDNGVGISPEHLSRIFDPFFTTKPVGQGQGLGLSISYAIVQAHGGSIEVESHLGKGTLFSVRLPTKGPTPPPT